MARPLLILNQIFLLFVLTISVTSCATPGTSGFQYRDPPGVESVANEVIVKLPFSDTWDLLIGQLAKSFFVINNVEKASRIINVSFSTDKPEHYIDCGTIERTFQYANESRAHTEPVAGSYSFKNAGEWGAFKHLPQITYVDRKTSLEGRINVYVAPKDNDTVVTVNARYIFTVGISGRYEFINGYGVVVQRVAIPESKKIFSFSTGQLESADIGPPEKPVIMKCRSTGKLENEILALVKR